MKRINLVGSKEHWVYICLVLEGQLDLSASARFLSVSAAKDKTLEKSEPSGQVCLHELEDEQLMARLQAGELTALEVLYDRYAGLLLGIGTRMLRNTTDAEDVVQEAFLYVFRNSSSFKNYKGSVRSWVIMVTYSRVLNRCRQLKARNQFSNNASDQSALNVVASSGTDPERLCDLSYWRSRFLEALLELSAEQRDTLRMYFFEGYTLIEISQELCHPIGSIRNYYYRGLERLRKQLLRNGSSGRKDK